METLAQLAPPAPCPSGRPRLGFLGVGWIGRNRMEALAGSGLVEVAAVADPSAEAVAAARETAPDAEAALGLDALLALAPGSGPGQALDGLVIATPSGAHAEQCVAALERGLAVFCQKPLARTAAEAQRVVDAARAADRPLGVDLSYRHVAGVPEIRDLVAGGALGTVYAVDLTFHNAWAPSAEWAYNLAESGGGCAIDLGVHLVDLGLWVLGYPDVETVESRLFAGGAPLPPGRVEDFAVAGLALAEGAASAPGAVRPPRVLVERAGRAGRPDRGRVLGDRGRRRPPQRRRLVLRLQSPSAATGPRARRLPRTGGPGAGAPPSPGPKTSPPAPGSTRGRAARHAPPHARPDLRTMTDQDVPSAS